MPVAGGTMRAHLFVATLGYSRRTYAKVFANQRQSSRFGGFGDTRVPRPMAFAAAFLMFRAPEAPGAKLANIQTVGGCAMAEDGGYACGYNPNPKAASPGNSCSQCDSLREKRNGYRTGAYVMAGTAATGAAIPGLQVVCCGCWHYC